MLTHDQLTAIDRHLRKENWLLNADLITELTDHYVAGIEDMMARGVSFEMAVRVIHAGFGGRKGLLKMEESFQQTQAKNFARLIRQRFASYFRLPRLLATGLLFLVVYGLVRLIPTIDGLHFRDGTIAGVALGGLCLLYILAYIRLIHQQKQPSATRSIGQSVWALVQGLNVALMGSFYVNLFLPLDRLAEQYPLIVALGVSLVILFELAVSELLLERFVNQRKPQVV